MKKFKTQKTKITSQFTCVLLLQLYSEILKFSPSITIISSTLFCHFDLEFFYDLTQDIDFPYW